MIKSLALLLLLVGASYQTCSTDIPIYSKFTTFIDSAAN